MNNPNLIAQHTPRDSAPGSAANTGPAAGSTVDLSAVGAGSVQGVTGPSTLWEGPVQAPSTMNLDPSDQTSSMPESSPPLDQN
jgi:hypothetical protein